MRFRLDFVFVVVCGAICYLTFVFACRGVLDCELGCYVIGVVLRILYLLWLCLG